MPDIFLGPTIVGATLLPPIRWVGGGAPDFPIDYSKQIDKAIMLGGEQRFNFRSHDPRRWTLSWEMLTIDELDDLIALNIENRELYFQNGWEDSVWREVVISAFTYAPVVKTGSCGGAVYYADPYYGSALYSTSPRFNLSMTLEEVR